MKEDQEQSGGALVPSASSALTKNSSGLVRRGLDDLNLSADSNASEVDANQSKSSRPVFDEETYEKAKPLFIAGVQHFKKAGMSFADALSALLDWLKESCEFTVQEIKDMKPYVLRFMKDWRAGRIHLDAEANVKGQGDINSSEPSAAPLTPFQIRLRNNFLKRLNQRKSLGNIDHGETKPEAAFESSLLCSVLRAAPTVPKKRRGIVIKDKRTGLADAEIEEEKATPGQIDPICIEK